jgi:transposase-like protein/IS1 family transposase
MHPQGLFCPNLNCPSRGWQEGSNIRIHDSLRNRWRCKRCGRTFSLRQGTPFYGLRTDEQTVTLVITLLALGCPVQAIVGAFQLDARTVARWQKRAGEHCQQLHTQLVAQASRDAGQVQADEIRVKTQRRGVVWMAMAMVVSSRLWLGGVVSQRRDKHLARSLAHLVHTCLRCAPLLLITDGWTAYVGAWQKAFRQKQYTGGKPRLAGWKGLVIAQAVKTYQGRQVAGIGVCHLFGAWREVAGLVAEGQVLHTAYIERLNATFRQRLCCLCRRSRALARLPETIEQGMYLVGCVYNFCTPHQTLSKQSKTPTTPAMAAGITQAVWSVRQLLWIRRVPLPWEPDRTPSKGKREPLSERERRRILATI